MTTQFTDVENPNAFDDVAKKADKGLCPAVRSFSREASAVTLVTRKENDL